MKEHGDAKYGNRMLEEMNTRLFEESQNQAQVALSSP